MPNVTGSLHILIDTNIFIAAEGNDSGELDNAELATKLYRDATKLGHRLCVGAGVREDFNRIADETYRRRRLQQLRRYHVLNPLPIPDGFQTRAGYPPEISDQSKVDLSLLLALERNAAQWLVTEDQRMLPHAQALGLQDRVFSLSDAVDVLAAQHHALVPIPAVDAVPGYALDPEDRIFDDFPAEYNIHEWLRTKVAPEHRPCLVMQTPGSPQLDAVAILKDEETDNWGLPGRVLKICTFKVADHAQGVKRGELLLWAVFEHARQNGFDSIFIEAFDSRADVIGLLGSFGFHEHCPTDREGELVFAKRLAPDGSEANLDPLDYNIEFGPGALKPKRFFIIPIVPTWHSNLFPIVNETAQLALIDELTVQGNAIRKAYVCRSPSGQLEPGDTILFLRTRRDQGVFVVGVVEDTLRSSDPTKVLTFTGQRTVYSEQEIDRMCKKGNVLSVRFRLDRVLDTPLTRGQLIRHRVMKRSPQSIQLVSGRNGTRWLKNMLSD